MHYVQKRGSLGSFYLSATGEAIIARRRLWGKPEFDTDPGFSTAADTLDDCVGCSDTSRGGA
jgi:hypothetical protein